MYRAAVVLQDDSDPVVRLTAGGLAARRRRARRARTASRSPPRTSAAGCSEAVIEVDGSAPPPPTWAAPRRTPRSCPASSSAAGRSRSTPARSTDGAHSVRVLSPTSAATPPPSGRSRSPPRTRPRAARRRTRPNLTTRVSRRGTIGYGGRLLVRGQLAGAAAGTQVRVLSLRSPAPARRRRSAGRRWSPTPRAASRYRVPAGPSRTLRFAYRNAGEAAVGCSKPVTVKVRAPVSLRPRRARSAPAQSVRFRGRLRGGYVPADGKLVELQAFERGRWRSLRDVRIERQGAFSYRYRFSFRASGMTFPVRPACGRRGLPVRARHVEPRQGSRALIQATSAASPSSKPRSSMSSSPAARSAPARCG